MRIGTKIRALPRLVRARLLDRPTPLVVGWSLGTRCPFRCGYCSVWRKDQPGLPTPRILGLIDEMAIEGVRVIQFTGGEPLLRDDLGEILERCRRHRISVSLSTTGHGMAARRPWLGAVGNFSISLDGPADVTRAIRGPGAHEAALEGIETARSLGRSVRISAVLSQANLDAYGYVLDVASRYRCRVMFQPAAPNRLQGDTPNPLAAQGIALQRVFDDLIRRKRAGDPAIGNSRTALEYLRRFPDTPPIPCHASRIAVRMTADGRLNGCPRLPSLPTDPNAADLGFRAAFDRILRPRECSICWVGARLELNLIMAGHVEAMRNAVHFT